MSLQLCHCTPPTFSSRLLHSLSSSSPERRTLLCCLISPKPSSITADTKTLPKTAIQRIAEKLRTLGYLEEEKLGAETSNGSAGEIFLPSSHHLPKHRVGYTIDTSWSTPENPVPDPGSGPSITRLHQMARAADEQRIKKGKEPSPPTLAELKLPEEELKRLRSIGIRLDKKLKVGKAGITEGIVNGIHERWRRSELVKIKCEDLCRMNMKRTHEILERKTGGLVVWRSGSIIILYRGTNYEYPYFLSDDNKKENILSSEESSELTDDLGVDCEQENNSLLTVSAKTSEEPVTSSRLAYPPLVLGVGSPKKLRFQLPGEIQLEEEADHLLDGLGPRFTDWWGYGPQPVDADLLPAFVPGYRRPFRLLPYGVNSKLTDREMTILRRLGRPLRCHFALGRNRNLQGLAYSMVKLWEKCEIAKIAVKRGVQNTNSEMMAKELKELTGGTLLSRDREFIVFYRGKDFLLPVVSSAVEERRKHGFHKEQHRTEKNLFIDTAAKHELGPAKPVSVDEVQNTNGQKRLLTMEQRKLKSTTSAVRGMEAKLSMALEKKAKAEKLLTELEELAEPQKSEVDKEGITEEERYMLRKVGLRMKAFLLLGRRGVFDGTIENMHLHWKYRELVKIISKESCIEDVHTMARTLEAESGGILVAVERVNKGHAIIVYRGKNYQRPAELRPQTLLNKRQAMKRSLEEQRQESLKLHVLKLTSTINEMKLELAKKGSVADCVQSTECDRGSVESDTEDLSGSVESAHHHGDVGAKKCLRVDSSSLHSIEYIASSSDSEENTNAAVNVLGDVFFNSLWLKDKKGPEVGVSSLHSVKCKDSSNDGEEYTNAELNVMGSAFPMEHTQDKSVCSLSKYDHEFDETKHTELEPSSSEPILDDVGYRSDLDSTTQPENLLMQGRTGRSVAEFEACVSRSGSSESFLDSARNECDSFVSKDKMENSDAEISFRAAPLSNRDRLLLRKQALKMKKRPVLAIGRSNMIAGVAKAIRMHFRKNPLAIVNVKGRAKGTSVQELVFELEQATGAVLVSQEPNKVILYRGWGVGEEPDAFAKKKRDGIKACRGRETPVSQQLLDAIRAECGLQASQVDVPL